MTKMWLRSLAVCMAAAAGQGLRAQSNVLDLPLQSQRAEISQRIGLTDITIQYHRPLVNGRKVWGVLIPYGQVWRAGANENTTIRFSDAVSIEGHTLPAGVYGLHMIPNADEWTIMFSKNSTSWGSFTYDEKEDALRVTVKPKAAEMRNALTYEFADPQPDSVVIGMAWDKVAVAFKASVAVRDLVEVSLEKQLRNQAQFTWNGWDDGGNYLLSEKVALDRALIYSNRSIEVEDRYDNEMTKSLVLKALGRKEDAAAAEAKALSMANPLQKHAFARQLLADKHDVEAFAIFRENAEKHPDLWYVHTGLARMYSAQGKFEEGAKEMKLAIAAAPAIQKSYLEQLESLLKAGQDINK